MRTARRGLRLWAQARVRVPWRCPGGLGQAGGGPGRNDGRQLGGNHRRDRLGRRVVLAAATDFGGQHADTGVQPEQRRDDRAVARGPSPPTMVSCPVRQAAAAAFSASRAIGPRRASMSCRYPCPITANSCSPALIQRTCLTRRGPGPPGQASQEAPPSSSRAKDRCRDWRPMPDRRSGRCSTRDRCSAGGVGGRSLPALARTGVPQPARLRPESARARRSPATQNSAVAPSAIHRWRDSALSSAR